MTTLDSRVLRYTDCYARRFATPGEARYTITMAAGLPLPFEPEGFLIKVQEGPPGREGEQHDVTVRRSGRGFEVEPRELSITAGDSVVWNAPDSKLMGFAVRGRDAAGQFDSRALASEALYTHAFGSPGEIAWTDANGSDLGGVIRVRATDTRARPDVEAWMARVAEGMLVVISGDRVEPATLDIEVGQTVFFAVEKARGITITDRQLLGGRKETTR
jgi:plastocyanin